MVSAASFTGTVGVPFSQFVVFEPGPLSPYSFPGTLPDGLSMDPDTGEISGTPTTPEVEHPTEIQVSNACGFASSTILITINPASSSSLMSSSSTPPPPPSSSSTPPSSSSCPTPVYTGPGAGFWTVGSSSDFATTFSGGPFSGFLVDSPVPGLFFDTIIGQWSGTPTLAGVYPFTVVTTNDCGLQGSSNVTFIISDAPTSSSNATSGGGY